MEAYCSIAGVHIHTQSWYCKTLELVLTPLYGDFQNDFVLLVIWQLHDTYHSITAKLKEEWLYSELIIAIHGFATNIITSFVKLEMEAALQDMQYQIN